MLQISKIKELEFEQYLEAIQFSYKQGLVGNGLLINPFPRYTVFKELGVELVLAKDDQEILGVCFVLPDQTPIEHHNFVWLFGMVANPRGKNIGALMLFKIMNWFPAIMCIGVTEIAEQLYRALRWKEYREVWRCVHPLDLVKISERYRGRIKNDKNISILKSIAPIYTLVENFGRFITNILTCCQRSNRSQKSLNIFSDTARINLVSQYQNLHTIRTDLKLLQVLNVGGIARVVRDELVGLERLFFHMKMWRELKKQKIIGMEYIAVSSNEKKRALSYGYLPLRMSVHYWDKQDLLSDFFKSLPDSNFSFASCDKIL